MTIINTFLLIAGIIPIAIFIDCFNTRRATHNPGYKFDENHRAGDSTLLFIPFAAFFYADIFWTALGGLAILTLYGCALIAIAHRLKFLNLGSELIQYTGSGSFLLTIVGYYIFFHQGWLTDDPKHTDILSDFTDNTKFSWWSCWPYAIYLICTAVAYTMRPSQGLTVLIYLIPFFNILPLFSPAYWWTMGGSTLLYMSLVSLIIRRVQADQQGAAAMIIPYLYMMTATASIMVYAFLF